MAKLLFCSVAALMVHVALASYGARDCQVRPGFFGPCSATCGAGVKSRPLIVTQQAANGGRPCPSPLLETVPCSGLPPCQLAPPRPQPSKCQYREGIWGRCSATCGNGLQSKKNTIFSYGSDCPPALEARQCPNLPPCTLAPQFIRPQPQRIQQRVQQRVQKQRFQPNVARTSPIRPNLVNPGLSNQGYGRPVNCDVWYDDWSQCSVTCGGGLQERTGRVEVHPANGGKPCPPLREQRRCNTQACQQLIENNYPVDCSKLDNGLVADPTNKCSHYFYTCSNGITREEKCYGKLYFDAENKVCDTYSNVFDCSGKRRAPTTYAPATLAPYTQAPEFDCTTQEDGMYADPLNKCSHRFFTCANGYSHEMQCNANMYFDAQAGVCERFAKVFDCTGQQFIPTPEPVKPVTEAPKPVAIDCTNLEDGDHADPEKQCSERFYACSNQVGFEKWCPGNTFFDAELKVCETYTRNPSCSGRPRPVERQSEEGVPTHVVVLVTFGDDLTLGYGIDNNQLKAAMAQAFQMSSSQIQEVQVLGSRQVRVTAAYSLLAALTRLSNGYNQLAITYQNRNIKITKVSVEKTITGDNAPRPTYPFDCEDLEDGDYPASECESYYWVCIGGTTERMECPGETKFDGDNDLCELAEYLPKCGGQPRPPVTEAPRQIQPIPVNFDCEQLDDGLYPSSEGACTQTYYSCANGEAYEFTCPAKTFFDAEEKACKSKVKIIACKHTLKNRGLKPSRYHGPPANLIQPQPAISRSYGARNQRPSVRSHMPHSLRSLLNQQHRSGHFRQNRAPRRQNIQRANRQFQHRSRQQFNAPSSNFRRPALAPQTIANSYARQHDWDFGL